MPISNVDIICNAVDLRKQITLTSCVEVPMLGVTPEHLAEQLQNKNAAFFSDEYFKLLFRPDELVALFDLGADGRLDHERINEISRFVGDFDASVKQVIAANIPRGMVRSV